MTEEIYVDISEYYEMLPHCSKEFVNVIVHIHDSYTNKFGNDFDWFEFIFELVENIVETKRLEKTLLLMAPVCYLDNLKKHFMKSIKERILTLQRLKQ